MPKELERAVEAVLGGALQNVVTSDEYVARDMIAYLRSNKLGRATFLPMTTITGRTLSSQERQLLSMPGCVGVASELVGFAPEYRGIVENLLGRTVVAENLDAGIEIMRRGKHAFRLVTLEGDVMHSGGSMTGGSSASRMTSLLSREREIKEHEELLEKIEQQIKDYELRLEKGEAFRQGVKQRRAQAFEDLHQAQIDVSIASERVRTLSAQRESHAQQEQRCDLLCAQIAENLSQIDSQLAGARSTQAGEERTSDEMNRRTGELSDILYEKREALDALREEAQHVRVTLAAKERDLTALTADGARMHREQEEIAAQLYQAHERRETLIVEHQNATQQMAADTQLAVACGEKLKDAQQTLSERQAQRGESQERVRALTQEIDALHEQLAQDQDKGHKAEMILSRTQAELTQMQQRIWDEYELTYAGAKEYLTEPFDLAASDRRTGDIRREIRAMGPVNVTAVEDYRACRERYEELAGQRDDLLKAEDDLKGIIETLQRQMERQFMENFRLMQQYFAETFAKLFGGGHAELRLLDESDVLGCGIEIVAQPPGKKLQLLSLLSGGERALTAIAILFAMLRLKPTPFCFLDEIEAMSPMLQVKLLRVLQEKEIVRLGGVDVIPVDVRIIAATNEDLPAIVRQGCFRRDLFYRLSVLPLQLPPLRERGQDVQLLLERIKEGLGASFSLSPAAMQVLMAHRWDGNVRELRNCVEYLAYLDKPIIQPEDLPPTIFSSTQPGSFSPAPDPGEPCAGDVTGQAMAQLRRAAGSDLPAYAFILSELCLSSSMGRKALAARAAEQGISMTEQTARTALLRLEELGLVEVRRGRGGSRPTSLGRAISMRLKQTPSF